MMDDESRGIYTDLNYIFVDTVATETKITHYRNGTEGQDICMNTDTALMQLSYLIFDSERLVHKLAYHANCTHPLAMCS